MDPTKKLKEKNIRLPPKSPTMLISKLDINRSENIASQGILSLSDERKLQEMKTSMATPSSSKGKEMMGECSIKNEVDDMSQVNAIVSFDANNARRVKRMLANRISAQKCRMKKAQYVSQLEMNVKALEEEIKIIAPQINYHDNQRRFLCSEKSAIHQRMAVLLHEKVFKDAEYEHMKKEKEKLLQLTMFYQQQQQQQQDFLMMENSGMNMMEDPGINMMEDQGVDTSENLDVNMNMNFLSSSNYNMLQ